METKKKTLGRRKIEIKKIEKRSSLQVAFSKARRGIFKKASELSILCGAEIAILVQSPADKIFAFGHPTVEALVDRHSNSNSSIIRRGEEASRRKYEYEQAEETLENEKRVTVEKEVRWWDKAVEGMELHQLEEFLAALEDLTKNVDNRLKLAEGELFRDDEFENLMALDFDSSTDHQFNF